MRRRGIAGATTALLWLHPNNGLLRIGALPAAKTLVLAEGPPDALRHLMRTRGRQLVSREWFLPVQDNAEEVAARFRQDLEASPIEGITPTSQRPARRRAS